MNTQTIAEYALAGIIVVMLGSLAGWYFFLRTQGSEARAADAARGYQTAGDADAFQGGAGIGGAGGAQTPTSPDAGRQNPRTSFFSSVYNAIFNRETGVTEIQATGGAPFGSASDGRPGFLTPPASTPRAAPRLWQLANTAAAGITLLPGGRARYVERATGYLVEADPLTASVTRITGTLMPEIYEAIFAGDESVIERYLDDSGRIASFAGRPTTTAETSFATSTRALEGRHLERDIRAMAADPVSGALFYLVGDSAGVAGKRTNKAGGQAAVVFNSAIRSWRTQWLADGRIVLQTAPADGVPGYAYALSESGALTPLLRAIPGLSVLPRSDGNTILYSSASANGAPALFVRATASSTPVQLPVSTVAEKCAWAPGPELIAYCGVPQNAPTAGFLDEWHQGAAHTADAVWRIDAANATAEIAVAADPQKPFDIRDPVIDSGGSYLAFINAADDSPWILRLEE